MKLILTIESGSLAGQEFDLSNGFITIGRSENSSIRFDPQTEKIASKQHAFIEALADGFFVTDNQSTNGTLVNGQKIQNIKLNNGDTIQFGANGVKANVKIIAQADFNFQQNIPTAEQIHQLPTIQVESPLPTPFGEFQLPQIPKENTSVEFKNSISGIGLGHLEAHPVQKPIGKYVVAGIMSFLIIILLVPVLLILGMNLGVVVAIIATVIAFLPAMIYILPIVWLDRYDPEPIWLLALSFAWGGVVAIFASYIINTLFGDIVYSATNSAALGNLSSAVISAPIFEESTKGIGLLLLLIFFRRDFDDVLDGIVFAGVIALGFATVENVIYYGRGILSGGSDELQILFFIRGILSPFAHVTFTAMIGIGCGISRESHNWAVRILAPIAGYIVAVILHAIWNGMTIVFMIIINITGLNQLCSVVNLGGQNEGLCAFFIAYGILQVPLFLIFLGFIIYVMRRQNRILKEMLAIDVARGMIQQDHLDIVTSAFRSLTWSLSGLTEGKYLNRRRYMRAIGKLGLSYWHIQRATAAQGQTGSFQQNPILRDEVLKWRNQV